MRDIKTSLQYIARTQGLSLKGLCQAYNATHTKQIKIKTFYAQLNNNSIKYSTVLELLDILNYSLQIVDSEQKPYIQANIRYV